MRIAIDTNIFSALWSREASAERVSNYLDEAARQGGLAISPIVYMEMRAHPRVSESMVNGFLDTMQVEVDWSLERAVWKLAAERFEQYASRRRRFSATESKRMPADFLVAAHALLRADRLVTLDQRRYRADFPELKLMTP